MVLVVMVMIIFHGDGGQVVLCYGDGDGIGEYSIWGRRV